MALDAFQLKPAPRRISSYSTHRAAELRAAKGYAQTAVNAVGAVVDIAAEVEREGLAPVVFEAGGGEDCVEDPVVAEGPADADGRDGGNLAIKIDADAEDPLDLLARDVGAAEGEGHVEVPETGRAGIAIQAGVGLDTDEPGVEEFEIDAEDEVLRLEDVRERGGFREAEAVALVGEAEAVDGTIVILGGDDEAGIGALLGDVAGAAGAEIRAGIADEGGVGVELVGGLEIARGGGGIDGGGCIRRRGRRGIAGAQRQERREKEPQGNEWKACGAFFTGPCLSGRS